MKTVSQVFAEALNLDGLELITSMSYASVVPDHRSALRSLAVERLSARLGPLSERVRLDPLINLDLRPRIDQWAISISHCPRLGGLAIAPGSFGLGFDVEESSRVSKAASVRVAPFKGERSIVDAFSPVSFWVAKESSIKAFGNLGLVDLNFTVVEITCMNADGTFTSRWKNHEARGLLIPDGDVTHGIAHTL
jgi:hypothetical protein